MLVFVVDDGQSGRKSTSIDVDDREISIDENVAVVNDKASLVVVDNNDNQEERAAVGFERKETHLNERDVDTKLREDESKPSNHESTSQSKKKKKKKKKASTGTESAQSSTQGKEGKKEEQRSSEGI